MNRIICASISRFIIGCLFIGGCGRGSHTLSSIAPPDSKEQVNKENEEDSVSPGGLRPESNVDSSIEDGEETVTDLEQTVQQAELINSSLVGIQVKNPVLLKASLAACFGSASSTLLLPDMFVSHDFLTIIDENEFSNSGRKQFLGKLSPYMRYTRVIGNDSNNGNGRTRVEFVSAEIPDVVEIESENLASTAGTARTAAAVDLLSDRYLRSLETVAQVIAHNCDLSKSNCQCDSPEKAAAMLRRCLPLVAMSEEKISEVASSMSKTCSESSFGTRQSIAALIASYSFAVRR